MTKESTIQKNIIDYLRDQGAYVFNVHGSPYQDVGTPDLLVCYEGRFYGFEVKRPGEKLTVMQKHQVAKVIGAGGVAHRVEKVGDVAEVLRR